MPPADRHRMLTVWWAHWPVVAAEIAGGTPLDSPAIVLAANRVVACSPAAAAVGVAVGQRRRVAQQRCPEAVLLDHQPDRDARLFDTVVRAVNELTPRLEIVEPGWLCIEARGPSRYYGGDERLGERLVATIGRAIGRRPAGVGIGIADGRFASAVAARLATATPSRTLVVAPDASLQLSRRPARRLVGRDRRGRRRTGQPVRSSRSFDVGLDRRPAARRCRRPLRSARRARPPFGVRRRRSPVDRHRTVRNSCAPSEFSTNRSSSCSRSPSSASNLPTS